MGSFVPWLYYSFYCEWKPQVIYLSIVIILGIGAVVVSTFDFFAGPRFRTLRAGESRSEFAIGFRTLKQVLPWSNHEQMVVTLAFLLSITRFRSSNLTHV